MFQSRKKAGNVGIKFQRIKEKLLQELSKLVKELQKHALNSGSFDISRNDECALNLTFVLEAIFLHGYQASSGPSFFSKSSGALPSPNFWDLLHPFTHKDVLHQLAHLSHITSNVGKCRAWLRLALNDGLMESYFHAILADKKKISHNYAPKAFLRDEEAIAIMMNHFLGLLELNFDLNYNTPSLNQWTAHVLQLSGIWEPPSAPAATMATRTTHQYHQSVPKAAIQSIVLTPNISTEEILPAQRKKKSGEKSSQPPPDTTVASSSATTPVLFPATTPIPSIEQTEDIPVENIFTSTIEEETLDTDGCPLADVNATTPTASQPPSGNMLGMVSGWSSTFEPEPAGHSPADTPIKQESSEPETKVIKTVTSFNGILTDYAIIGSKKYSSNESEELMVSSPAEKDELEVLEKSGNFVAEKSSGFEIVADPSSPEDIIHAHSMSLMSSVSNIAREHGLDRQNYKCQGCSRPIGMIYGQYKVCAYDGSYYCYECHTDDEHIIPSKVVHNWDLSKYKVARHVKLFLMQINEEPLFHIDEINPTLYNVISEINKVKQMRVQLQNLKGYVMTCRNSMISEDVKRRMWPREYLWDDIHQYSLLDLIQVNSGQLQHYLKKIISFCKKHVYGCEVCSQKGFICEICKDSKIVYAFEANYTAQCPRCKAVFHKQCKIERQCPRCLRRRSRRQIPEDSAEHGQSSADLNPLF